MKLELNKDTLSSNFELAKLVVCERYRFREPLLNAGDWDSQLDLVTYDMVTEYFEGLTEEYNTLEDLDQSEDLYLIFTYLINKALNFVDEEECLEEIKMYNSITRGINALVGRELLSCFEEVE